MFEGVSDTQMRKNIIETEIEIRNYPKANLSSDEAQLKPVELAEKAPRRLELRISDKPSRSNRRTAGSGNPLPSWF